MADGFRKNLNGAVVGAAACLAGVAGLAAASRANDTTAVMGAGGLELVYNSAIAMVAEDLYVGAEEVRVSYRFRNVTKAPVTSTVAFPLPLLGGQNFLDMNIAIPNWENDNYVDFQVWLSGDQITPNVEHRAIALGLDRTDMITAAGVPLNPILEVTGDALRALPPAQLQAFAEAGLIVREEWGTFPVWSLQTTFYWEQTFPPGQDVVVEHSYRPIVGYSFFSRDQLNDPDYVERYCIDDDFRAAATRLFNAQGGDFPLLNEQKIEYILTTANNWASPIGQFTLTVDKGSPNALVSFCGEGVTRQSPTTFVDTETDFYAQRELEVLIVTPITP